MVEWGGKGVNGNKEERGARGETAKHFKNEGNDGEVESLEPRISRVCNQLKDNLRTISKGEDKNQQMKHRVEFAQAMNASTSSLRIEIL